MIILPPERLNVDRLLRQGILVAVSVLGVTCASSLLFFFVYPWEKDAKGAKKKESKLSSAALFPYETIGTGSLTLNARHALGWVSRIAEELILIAYNSRPDVSQRDVKMLFSLKSSKEQLTLLNGKTLGLQECDEGKGFLPSQEGAALWVKPILLDDGSVLVEAGRKYGDSSEEKGQFVINRASSSSRSQGNSQAFIQDLKSARCFGGDLLIQGYGGWEHASWKQKHKLEFRHGASTYACFVSLGDYLLYQDGEWAVGSIGDLAVGIPIAKVKAVSTQGIEIEGWDEGGFYSAEVKLEMQKPQRASFKADSFPASIRLRSSTQVSCLLGKKRVIIKQGDWVLKTATGYRNLRRREEIDQCLHHRIKGELFIFDSIEKENGKLVMKGHIFDEMRTQVQPLTLPIDGEKKEKKGSRRRRQV